MEAGGWIYRKLLYYLYNSSVNPKSFWNKVFKEWTFDSSINLCLFFCSAYRVIINIFLNSIYYQGWNRSPAQVGYMRQALGPGALGRPGGSGWRGRWEGGMGWGRHVNSRPFHFNVWQNSLQIKKKKKRMDFWLNTNTLF